MTTSRGQGSLTAILVNTIKVVHRFLALDSTLEMTSAFLRVICTGSENGYGTSTTSNGSQIIVSSMFPFREG